MQIRNVLFILCFAFIHFFCVGNNTAPVIESIVATPDSVAIGEQVQLVCIASDAEDSDLVYLWECTTGSLSESVNDTANWTAPIETGYFSVSCEVSDSNNGTSIETIEIKVF
tara:strand:+ start:1225 stop:1560 length:336 start_codon:yes stop_codon:yes gene_type:complete